MATSRMQEGTGRDGPVGHPAHDSSLGVTSNVACYYALIRAFVVTTLKVPGTNFARINPGAAIFGS